MYNFMFDFVLCFQTAIVPHVSLDIHHADFGRLQDPKAVEQKVQCSGYGINIYLKLHVSCIVCEPGAFFRYSLLHFV